MPPRLQSYPPLGQVTTITGGNIELTVALDSQARQKHSSDQLWRVALWYSSDGEPWTHLDLEPLQKHLNPSLTQSWDSSTSLYYFSASLVVTNSCRFTITFRCGDEEPWKWVHDETGLDDGLIIVTDASAASDDLLTRIPDLDETWTRRSLMSQSPRSRLWILEHAVSPASKDTSTTWACRIGSPWGSYLRWFALVRQSPAWLAPRQGKGVLLLDKEAILCSFLSHRGKHLVFLAISGLGDVLATFHDNPDGGITLEARNDSLTAQKAMVLVAEGADFDNAVAAVMYEARALVSRARSADVELDKAVKISEDQFRPAWRESWYDGLGYCTWNALGQKLTAERVIDAVDTLSKNGIKPSCLILDDNWQSIDYMGDNQFQHGWNDFEAEPNAFSGGLAALVAEIKHKHSGIEHVAVWHALLGYWGGIAPDGNIAKRYKTIKVSRQDSDPRNLPINGEMTVVAQEDVARLYDDFYRFLARAGIDAVKTDVQAMMDTWINASPRRDLMKTYLDSWTISSLRHFSIKAISCMSQFPQALFLSQMPQNRLPMLVRNSDDFFPDVAASHPWHIWANAHNSIFTQHLNVLPDWDMFQTAHKYATFHAVARCVSGGPIYITDVPGEHDLDLIRRMTGETPRGNTVILRPSVVGKSLHTYQDYHDPLLLKIGSYHGASMTGTPILAVFNTWKKTLMEMVPLSMFPGTVSSQSYVIRAHSTGKLTPPMTIGTSSSLIVVSLEVCEAEIFWACPLTRFRGNKFGETLASNLGLVGKMTGCAAIVSSTFSTVHNGRVLLDTQLKALGTLGLYLSSLPDMKIDDDFLATMQEQPIPRSAVAISTQDSHVLEIDIAKAWDELGLKSRWSNEAGIKVYFNI